MKEKVEILCKEIEEKINNVTNLKELSDLKVEYMGKKGIVTELQSGIKEAADKKEYGMQVNLVRSCFNENYETKLKQLQEEEINRKLESERIDITLPSTKIRRGTKHPMSITIEKIEDLFVSMGYDVVKGPELETDEYCFERLNLPKGHPARDMQDSFYVDPEHLLRTQTSAVQARVMMANEEKSPIRVICPGKTYI